MPGNRRREDEQTNVINMPSRSGRAEQGPPQRPGQNQQPPRPPQDAGRQPMEQPLPGNGAPVRPGQAEDAYRLGERMGAEELMRQAGTAPISEGRDQMGGMGPGGPVTPETLAEARKTLMKYKAGKASVDRRIIHAQQWWKLRNWHEIEAERQTKGASLYKSNTAWLWNCIVGKHADAIDSYPEPVILPRMLDDKEEAEKLSNIVPVVMEMNDFEEVYNDCAWQKMQEGTAGYGVFWDGSKNGGMGDIAIKKINLLNLFWEPGITDIQDSKNLFYVTLVDNDQLEGMYPQLQGKLRNAQFSVVEYRTDDHVDITDKSAVIDWYYHKWQGNKKVLHYVKFVAEEILYSTENQGMVNGLYDDGLFPYVLDPLFPVEGSPCGYGYIDIGKDAQIDIDTLNQAMVKNAEVSATPRYFIRKDGGVNEDEFTDLSKPIIHSAGDLGQQSILPVTVPIMNGNVLKMLQQKIDELKFVTGNTDINNGGVPSGVTAASAIAALKEDSGRTSKDSTRAAYRAYSKIVTMVIERIRQFYDLPRQFRILGAMGEEFVQMDNSGLKPQVIPGGLGLEDGLRLPVFDVQVRAQRENAYTKMSQNELALQLYGNGFFAPAMTDQALMALDMMDFKGKEELQQKVEQQGTLLQTLQQVGQIALALAQKYDPSIANQLAGVLQNVVMEAGGGSPVGLGDMGATPNQNNDAMTGDKSQENAIVRRARERSANAARPD